MQKLHRYMQHIYSIIFAQEEKKKHLHCTLGNSTPIYLYICILLTINHYQWVVKIKCCFPMAAGGEIHQKCVTGHKETRERTTEQNMIEQNILQRTHTEFHYGNGTVTFSKSNSPVGNKCNTITHNAVSIAAVRDVGTLRKQREVNSLSGWNLGARGLLAVREGKHAGLIEMTQTKEYLFLTWAPSVSACRL